MNANLRNFALWVIIVLLLLALFTLFQNPGQHTTSQDVSFSQLLNEVDQGRVRDVLIAVGLPQLASRLEEDAHWNRMLSLGEQQRLGIARALLHAPQYLFLDEATASLDEASEAALYHLIREKLPATAVVSIGHRSTLAALHQRNVVLSRDGDRFALQNRREDVKQP